MTQYQQLADLIADEQQGAFVVYHPDTGEFLELNVVGQHLWGELAQPRTVEDLTDSIVSAFEVDPGVARADVMAFLEELTASAVVTVA